MKKIIIIAAAVIVALGALLFGFSYFMGKKHAACTTGEGQPAIEACTFMIKYYPVAMQKVTYLLKRATQRIKTGDNKSVIADMEEVLALNEKEKLNMPDGVLSIVYNLLASSYGATGDIEKASKYAELAAKAGSSDLAVYLNLSTVYIKQKRYREAVERLKDAEKLDPSNSAIYFNYAMIALAVPDYPLGYAYLQKSRSYRDEELSQGRAPDIDEVRFYKTLALASMGLKRYGEAEDILTNLAKSGLDCPDCEKLLAQNSALAAQFASPAKKPSKTKKRRSN